MEQSRNREADVVVVGSGAAGLTAAIVAHDRGARVVVVEAADKIGGTSALSGGGVWIPLNHHMAEVGEEDSRDEALEYCTRLTAGRAPRELVEKFVDTGHKVIRYLEEKTPLKFRASSMPDYHAEMPGGKAGRTLDPGFFPLPQLGDWAPKIPPSPMMVVPLTIDEAMLGMARPASFPLQAIEERMSQGLVGSGNALIAGLLKACLDRGIEFMLETRAVRLLQQNGRVVGVEAVRREEERIVLQATKGTILACGGFEWNQELWHRFIPGPVHLHCSTPFNRGDGLLMTLEIGADLGNMPEAWLYPGASVPGEEYEGRPVSRWVIGERSLPHSIMVNRHGLRFVNEAVNYNDMSKALYAFDPTEYTFRNIPCWVIMDSQFRAKYPILTVMPTDPDPEWLPKAETLEDLAAKLGIDCERLQDTVDRWNEFAKAGVDREFQRGNAPYERWLGDPSHYHPNIGTIERPPFYALTIHVASAGTKGGPRTNVYGQVLNVRGQPIEGLYAAGNVMASVAGPGYYGGGGTIGLAVTWGYLSAMHATGGQA